MTSPLSLRWQAMRKIFWRIIHGIIGFFLIIPCFVFVVIVQLPIYFYRLLVTKLFVPCFRPKIGKAVTVKGQFMATEFLKKYANKSSKYVILTTLVHRGKLTFAELRELILTRWINAKREEDDTLCYPEFQQYIESWMGFMFWKQVAAFDVNDHIFVHELDNQSNQESDEFLANLNEKLLNEPFIPRRSPWEVHLIQNYKTCEFKNEEMTALVIRFHHTFGDGFALAHVIIEALFGSNFENVQMQVPREKWQRKPLAAGVIINTLALPFQFLQNLGYILSIACSKQYIWKRQKIAKVDLEGDKSHQSFPKQIFAKSYLISVDKLKMIKNKVGVTLSSVLLSSLSASLSKNFQTTIPVIRKNNVRVSIMLPTAGHRRQKLRHHTNGAIFAVNTHPHMNYVERLLETEKILKKTKASFVPSMMFALLKVLSASLATPFASLVNSCPCVPVCTTNFRGPERSFGWDSEKEVLALDVVAGTFSDLMVVMCSYNGQMRVTFTSTDNVLDRNQLEELLKEFCDEIENLYEMTMKAENNC